MIIAGFLFFGSLWGIIEASFGDWLYSNGTPYPSLYLTALAFVILATSKVFLRNFWSGTAIGLIAMLFKLVNMPFFACHLLAIALLGAGFDIAYGVVTNFYKGKFRLPVAGLIGAYLGRALFAVIITYLIRYEYWLVDGHANHAKAFGYIFLSGTVSAVIGMIAVPAGNRIAEGFQQLLWTNMHPRLSTASVFAATFGIWLIQRAI